MKRNRKTAWLLGSITLLVAIALTVVVYRFLPFHAHRIGLIVGLLIVGFLSSIAIHVTVVYLPEKRWVRFFACTLFCFVIFSPVVSIVMQRVTYSRFGLTVYGITPVPFLDISVDRNGIPWFREKSHRITRAEIEALLTTDVEVVVIGDGWNRRVRLADNVSPLLSEIEIHILSTPKALELYNTLVSQGRVVVLLAHSTC